LRGTSKVEEKRKVSGEGRITKITKKGRKGKHKKAPFTRPECKKKSANAKAQNKRENASAGDQRGGRLGQKRGGTAAYFWGGKDTRNEPEKQIINQEIGHNPVAKFKGRKLRKKERPRAL